MNQARYNEAGQLQQNRYSEADQMQDDHQDCRLLRRRAYYGWSGMATAVAPRRPLP